MTFRVFDQGCAYRIETHLPGERTVAGEVAEFNFAGDPGLFAAYSDGLCNAYQSQYEKCRLSALGTENPSCCRWPPTAVPPAACWSAKPTWKPIPACS